MKQIVLVLSPKAAKVLLKALGRAHVVITEPGGEIIQAIVHDLNEQIEGDQDKPKRRKKK